ncbi:hypothetical protein JOS77_05970 [Chromobacterium haemolyticum]|nr:hypothetical protein JOS77_05970 [Chromobacterium haemolyticum]
MRRLFIQFYLLLMTCFLVAVVLVGAVYKQAVDDVGERYLSDLLRTTLSLIEADLRGVPEDRWSETLANSDHGFTFRVKVEKMSSYLLDDESKQALDRGEIVMLEDKYVFLQKLEDSNYLLVAGPLRYLFFLHQLNGSTTPCWASSACRWRSRFSCGCVRTGAIWWLWNRPPASWPAATFPPASIYRPALASASWASPSTTWPTISPR